MKKFLGSMGLAAITLALSGAAVAQHSGKEREQDVARHRAMAVAHESAAQCLAAGKAEDACMAALQKACKDLAIGKYCGMKHAH